MNKNAKEKPKAKLIGKDGNIFCLVGIAQDVLRKAGQKKEAEELFPRIQKEAKDYNHALRIIMEYVEVE